MFFRLEGRECLVVGAGPVAEEKISRLLESGARVRVIAPQATAHIARLARRRKLEWLAREFRVRDASRAFLVVAATSSPEVHERVWRAARRARVLCNVVDDPKRCDFFYPAVMRRGALQIAISTGGRSPALAQQIRKRMEKQFGAEYAEWVARLGQKRSNLLSAEPDAARRKERAHKMAREVTARKIA
jgi:precorrin-2 dehydrogenase/sirohydrochlorin ferrochelatase